MEGLAKMGAEQSFCLRVSKADWASSVHLKATSFFKIRLIASAILEKFSMKWW